MTASIDEKAFEQAVKGSDLPKRAAGLAADRNRWFVAAVLLILAMMFMTALSWHAFNKASNNKEVVYVKLHPNGSWDIADFAPEDEQIFFKSTVDNLLERYLKTRFGVLPETVKRDYAEAATFMAPALYEDFVSSQAGGFNAIQKAADIQDDTRRAERIEIKWKFPDHYDQVAAVFDKEKEQVVRTNVYFKKTTKSASGRVKGEPEHLIARLQWRLLPKTDLQEKSKAWLRANPIGLQIVSQEIITDPSAQEVEK